MTKFTSICDEFVVGMRGGGGKQPALSSAVFTWNCPHLCLPENVKISPASGITASFLLSLTFHSAAFEMTL